MGCNKYLLQYIRVKKPDWVVKNMDENKIKYSRKKIRKGSDQLLLEKPFALGMYRFIMFIIRYYSRVRSELKIDYYSFIILQTVVSHS